MTLSLSLARAAETALNAAKASSSRQLHTAALVGWRRQNWTWTLGQRNTVDSRRCAPRNQNEQASTTSKSRRPFCSGRLLPPVPCHSSITTRTYITSHFPPPRNLSPRQPSRPKSAPGVLAAVQFLSTALGKGDDVHRNARLSFSPGPKQDRWSKNSRGNPHQKSLYVSRHGPKRARALNPPSEAKLNGVIREMGMYNTHLKAARVVMLECLAGREAELRGKGKCSTAYQLEAERLKVEMALEKVVNETRIIDDMFEDIAKRRRAPENPILRERVAEEQDIEDSEWEDIEEMPVEERRSASGVA